MPWKYVRGAGNPAVLNNDTVSLANGVAESRLAANHTNHTMCRFLSILRHWFTTIFSHVHGTPPRMSDTFTDLFSNVFMAYSMRRVDFGFVSPTS